MLVGATAAPWSISDKAFASLGAAGKPANLFVVDSLLRLFCILLPARSSKVSTVRPGGSNAGAFSWETDVLHAVVQDCSDPAKAKS